MDKAYIVANEQQECKVIDKIKQSGVSPNGNSVIDTFVSSLHEIHSISFPYVIHDKSSGIGFDRTDAIYNHRQAWNVVYDGRKEEKMSEKYVVSQEFMNELEEWKKRGNTDVYFVGSYDISMLPIDVIRWWDYPEINNSEQNNRLIAIIRWVNGEDVFEVKNPKKWVVRSKKCTDQGSYLYVYFIDRNGIKDVMTGWTTHIATKFDTKEEAQSWANSHQEVVEVVDV